MSTDSFTEVTNQSWFGRIGGAIKGIFFGLLLFIVAIPLLFWNEGRAVRRYQTLQEGAGAVVSVAADKVDPANEGKLVHVSGPATTEETLADPSFAVSTTALILRRSVEMYQWKESTHEETHKKLGGGTETRKTYTYSKTWSEQSISSANFKDPSHQNPGSFPVQTTDFVAQRAHLGAFTLPPAMVARIRDFIPLAVPASSATLDNKARPSNGGFYIGADPAAPQVGDIRITFQRVPPGDLSIVARQVSGSFTGYVAKAGGTIELIRTGLCSAADMFKAAEAENKLITWLVRLGGFLLMLVGLTMVFKPLSVLADVLPFLGTLVGMGTGLIAFGGALVGSMLTIAVAWFAYRPLLAGLLVAACVGLLVLLKVKARPKVQV